MGKVASADGWSPIVINANSTQIRVDNTSHYDIDQDYCVRASSGAMDLPTWNSLANGVNSVLQTPDSSQETCYDLWDDSGVEQFCPIDSFGDKISVTLADGSKRTLFEYKDAQLCTHIADQQVAKSLLKTLSKVVRQADTAQCEKPYWRCPGGV